MKKEHLKFVICDPLTGDYLVSFIHGDMWSQDLLDITEEALFESMTKAQRVVKLIVDRYEKSSDDDVLAPEVHSVRVETELWDLNQKDTYD